MFRRAGDRAAVQPARGDAYLEFLGGRCRPNTVLAAGYDLKVLSLSWARRRMRFALLMCWRSSPPRDPVAWASMECCSR